MTREKNEKEGPSVRLVRRQYHARLRARLEKSEKPAPQKDRYHTINLCRHGPRLRPPRDRIPRNFRTVPPRHKRVPDERIQSQIVSR